MADRASHKLTRDEVAALRNVLGRSPDVLVSARGPQGFVALLRDRMVVRREQGWQLIAWVDVQRGGWDSEDQRLYWQLVDGTRSEITLNQNSVLAYAFAERVRASIVVSRQIQLDDGLGTVLIVGRRQPGSDDPISWQVEGLGRCDLNDPRVQSMVLGLVEETRSEFE